MAWAQSFEVRAGTIPVRGVSRTPDLNRTVMVSGLPPSRPDFAVEPPGRGHAPGSVEQPTGSWYDRWLLVGSNQFPDRSFIRSGRREDGPGWILDSQKARFAKYTTYQDPPRGVQWTTPHYLPLGGSWYIHSVHEEQNETKSARTRCTNCLMYKTSYTSNSSSDVLSTKTEVCFYMQKTIMFRPEHVLFHVTFVVCVCV